MGQLEDLFIQNFNVSCDTLINKSNGQPINAWKFGDNESTPFFETPEFVGYVDSALYHLTEEFSEQCICEYDASVVNQALDEVLEAQISNRITEVFNEEIAIATVDHMFKYSKDVQVKTILMKREAQKLLQSLIETHGISSIGMQITFDNGTSYGLEEDDPIISAIDFSYGYQQGWDAFKEIYTRVRVFDHKGFANDIISNYFSEPDRALPFTYPDLVARLSELGTGET